uniref:C3H1-type domain-containing protein n=1 Tax=Solanum lycopersicum TaxID=4081 RepID=A0A3Q7J8V2_SOLLC
THKDAFADSNVQDSGFERIRPSGRQLDAEELTNFSGEEAISDLKKTSPRLDVLKTTKRSDVDSMRCIKGNSCRFLHISHETSKIPHDKGENLRMRGCKDRLHPNSQLECTSKYPAFPSFLTRYSWNNDLSQDTRYSPDYTITDIWEPSIPFRPSFLLSQMILYPISVLYDGIRDSIDQSNEGYGSFSVLTKNMQANAGPASTGTNKV